MFTVEEVKRMITQKYYRPYCVWHTLTYGDEPCTAYYNSCNCSSFCLRFYIDRYGNAEVK